MQVTKATSEECCWIMNTFMEKPNGCKNIQL